MNVGMWDSYNFSNRLVLFQCHHYWFRVCVYWVNDTSLRRCLRGNWLKTYSPFPFSVLPKTNIFEIGNHCNFTSRKLGLHKITLVCHCIYAQFNCWFISSSYWYEDCQPMFTSFPSPNSYLPWLFLRPFPLSYQRVPRNVDFQGFC